jgi:hypothetical protein
VEAVDIVHADEFAQAFDLPPATNHLRTTCATSGRLL